VRAPREAVGGSGGGKGEGGKGEGGTGEADAAAARPVLPALSPRDSPRPTGNWGGGGGGGACISPGSSLAVSPRSVRGVDAACWPYDAEPAGRSPLHDESFVVYNYTYGRHMRSVQEEKVAVARESTCVT
jgi:hypothetical protein